MTKLLKAIKSGPNSCDILYEMRREVYTDLLSIPVQTETGVEASRFTFTPAGGCKYTVAKANDYELRSAANPAFLEDSTKIPQADSEGCVAVNCRDATILSTIKARLEAGWNVKPAVKSQALVAIVGSLNVNNTCEYKATKDVFVGGVKQLSQTETVISAPIETEIAGSTCSYKVGAVREFFSDDIEFELNKSTLDYVPKIGGQAVSLPILYDLNYANPPRNINPAIDLNPYVFS
jgi:hypothetical protein